MNSSDWPRFLMGAYEGSELVAGSAEFRLLMSISCPGISLVVLVLVLFAPKKTAGQFVIIKKSTVPGPKLPVFFLSV